MRNTLRSPKAHVYICGDSLMANAVTASLTQVIGRRIDTDRCHHHACCRHICCLHVQRLALTPVCGAVCSWHSKASCMLQAFRRTLVDGRHESFL